jgi:hypothetical protein
MDMKKNETIVASSPVFKALTTQNEASASFSSPLDSKIKKVFYNLSI